MSNEFRMTDFTFLLCRLNLTSHLSQRLVKQRWAPPNMFCIGEHFEIKFGLASGGHTMFDYGKECNDQLN